MERRLLLGAMLSLLLIGILTLGFNIQPVKSDWTGTIHIKADGSVEPDTAPISSVDNITYTLMDNINGSIVIERDNITLDGASYAIYGDESYIDYEKGIDLSHKSNITIKNTKISYCTWGIWLNGSNNNVIFDNGLYDNEYGGIVLHNSLNNSITDNNLTETPSQWTTRGGIEIANSHSNEIARNSILQGQGFGIELSDSCNNTLVGNVVQKHRFGITLSFSNSNILFDNSVSYCTSEGIYLSQSGNNTLVGNVMSDNTSNFSLYGSSFQCLDNHVDKSNTVDGKPIYYSVGATNEICGTETDAGVVYLVNCDNITIRDLTLMNSDGAFLWNTTNSKIQNVTVQQNGSGIRLVESDNNAFAGNTIAYNSRRGIRIDRSDNNTFCDNIVSNTQVGTGIILDRSNNNVISSNIVSSNNENGIHLYAAHNNTVIDNTVSKNLEYGVYLYSSENNTLSKNTVSNSSKCGIGLRLFSRNNTISGNLVSNSTERGIELDSYNNHNSIFHNNFIDNNQQVYSYKSTNVWDDGYPSGGNYWNNYAGFDLDHDGIGDTPNIIDADNGDNYPLMGPFNTFSAGTWDGIPFNVDVVSNSTVSAFYFNPDEGAFLRFNVTGLDGSTGFSRVTIPKDLLWTVDDWVVLVGDQQMDYTMLQDDNHTYLYFTYEHSTKIVKITGTNAVPEFPPIVILPLLMALTLLAVVSAKRKRFMPQSFNSHFVSV